jgi:hypothetical protein
MSTTWGPWRPTPTTFTSNVPSAAEVARIGVTVSEEYQLHPEQSTSAIVVHHPEAKYFIA